MKQSGNELIIYTSRRKKLNNMRISPCKKRQSLVNSFPKKRVGVKRKNEKDRNETVWGRRKIKRKLRECDEATRLQRRARYLLIRIKLEKNLLEAYCADGWKGRSREKIKPEKELERAKKEIVKCKLGIREILRELDLFISTCQCGSHQNCLESPGKVPGTDHSKLCKYDENKMKIIEAINAHLCTSFSLHSSYVDIFKEDATNPNGKDSKFKDEKEWPSDESDDEDYNPEINEVTCSSDNETEETYSVDFDLSSSPSYNSNNEKINLEEADEGEIMNRPRQRRNVDYKKLHDEMFGKDAGNEEESEDEEWGPHVRKKSRIEASDDGCMVFRATKDANRVLNDDVSAHIPKRSRIPSSALKELRQAFAKNELPSRSVKDNLSKKHGLSPKKVDRWFKNARYAAIKLRKASASNCEGKNGKSDRTLQKDRDHKMKMVQDKVPTPKRPVAGHVMRAISLQSSPGKRCDSKEETGSEHEKVWLDLVGKMCTLHNRVHNLMRTLSLVHGGMNNSMTIEITPQEENVMRVPFAQLKEKGKI